MLPSSLQRVPLAWLSTLNAQGTQRRQTEVSSHPTSCAPGPSSHASPVQLAQPSLSFTAQHRFVLDTDKEPEPRDAARPRHTSLTRRDLESPKPVCVCVCAQLGILPLRPGPSDGSAYLCFVPIALQAPVICILFFRWKM